MRDSFGSLRSVRASVCSYVCYIYLCVLGKGGYGCIAVIFVWGRPVVTGTHVIVTERERERGRE